MSGKLKLYSHELLESTDENKSYVLLSAGFLNDFNTMTNQKIYSLLKQDYNVYGIDNSGHGSQQHKEFTVDNQKNIIKDLLGNIKNNTHLVCNSLPSLITLAAIYELLGESYKDVNNLKSITLLSPVFDLNKVLDYKSHKEDQSKGIMQSIDENDQKRLKIKTLAGNLYRNLDSLQKLSESEFNNYQNNIDNFIKINSNIPIHIIGNTGDTMVTNDFENFIELLNQNNITYTFQKDFKHYIDIDTLSTYRNGELNNITIGESIEQFIKQND